MDVQIAEQPAEGQMLVGREVWSRKKITQVLGERAMDLVLLAVATAAG